VLRSKLTARILPAALAPAALALVAGTGLPHATAAKRVDLPRAVSPGSHPPYRSPELWATINVCSPKDAPGVVGIRGSMPSDGQPKDIMYMRFQLQYYDTTTGKWLELGQTADSGLLRVGSGSAARQDGRSFTLAASAHPFKLRGFVAFEWVRGKRVVYSAQRATSAGHKSLAGADPAGFSAATCLFS
jgi:hypothetical protein